MLYILRIVCSYEISKPDFKFRDTIWNFATNATKPILSFQKFINFIRLRWKRCITIALHSILLTHRFSWTTCSTWPQVCLLIFLREIVGHKKRKSLFWSFIWKLFSFYFYSYCNQRRFIILANIETKYPFVKLHGLQWTHVRFITNNSLNQNIYHL